MSPRTSALRERRSTQAGPEQPALGFGLVLEPSAIAEQLLGTGTGAANTPCTAGGAPSGIAVSDAPDALPDAVVRLLRLLDEPRDRAVLAPLVSRARAPPSCVRRYAHPRVSWPERDLSGATWRVTT